MLKKTYRLFFLHLNCASSSAVGYYDDSSTDSATVSDTDIGSGSELDSDSDTDIDSDTDAVDSSTEFEDRDSDGWFNEFDCDDENPAVHPGAEEIYDPPNNIDDDCDGLTDEEPWEDPNARAIPKTCTEAAAKFTSVGCKFYATFLPNIIEGQFSIAVANVQLEGDAYVVVEQKKNGIWVEVVPPLDVGPLDLDYFDVPKLGKGNVGIGEGKAYRITSDIPIAVYQFNPLSASSFSSDASMLYPVTALDIAYDVISVGGFRPYFSVVATADDTRFEITPTLAIPTGRGGNPPPTLPGVTREMWMNEGDVLYIRPQSSGNFDGTTIRSDSHPMALFTGHICHGTPCDHLEDQLSGIRSWGKKFVAANLPVREPPPYEPEVTKWRIYAAFDDTEITITAPPEIKGLPASPFTLQGGEVSMFSSRGTLDVPGDFVVESSEPIAVISAMIGSGSLKGTTLGDALVAQIPPTEQFLPRYVVLVPSERAWPEDYAVITRTTRSEVRYDGVPIPNSEFTAVGSDWEVARYRVTDGVHDFDSDGTFGIVIVGIGVADSFGYIGGVGTKVINHTVP